jgi:NADH-quinone oxidoreductase subunit I
MKVKRIGKLSLWDRLYFPSIFGGMALTFRHIFRKKDTLQYPEERRRFGERYRGVPALVKDQDGREKCVACYMCQWVCPPLAISIEAAEYPRDHRLQSIEKFPARFDINMLRCIYCGLCEEACPEEAIFMSKTYVVTGLSREVMIFDKDKLYQIGGVRPDPIKKWKTKGTATARRGDSHPATGSQPRTASSS